MRSVCLGKIFPNYWENIFLIVARRNIVNIKWEIVGGYHGQSISRTFMAPYLFKGGNGLVKIALQSWNQADCLNGAPAKKAPHFIYWYDFLFSKR